MKILLIGNGFDLEHNLPTSYKDFLAFCEKAREIYTYSKIYTRNNKAATLHDYIQNNLNGWGINKFIKEILSEAFINRKLKTLPNKDMEVTTQNKGLDELYTHIKHNIWLEYFLESPSYIGENWIDFESEISKVIQILDETRTLIINNESIMDIGENKSKILTKILEASKVSKMSKVSLHDEFKEIREIDNFIAFLNTELERLIRALEIYIAEFVHEITITKKNVDIERLNPDHILSFNYSDTYERVYGKEKGIDYNYIHGKADINKNMITSNLVLGIDEYLDDNRKDEELEFLTFKKFYQRIYKSTENDYLDWVDEIKEGYADYLKKESDAYARAVESLKDRSFDFPYEKNICGESLNIECPEHTLYIFGHSLDVTDRDILKMFICNDNVQTKIFYYRENKDDKKVLGKLIRNLIRIMGQDELLRRTGGIHKTIEFIPQTISEEEE